MRRANLPNEEACQSLLLKMRDEGLVKFDIHKRLWLIGRSDTCGGVISPPFLFWCVWSRTVCDFVGWAKARLRRAHHLSFSSAGMLRFAHPTFKLNEH